MQLEIEIGVHHEFDLKKIFLYYANEKNSGFLTEHDPIETNGELEIGPGKLMTTAFLKDLTRSLSQISGLTWLPSRVLAFGSDAIAWWTPARRRAMFFAKEEAAGLNGKVFPQPALVYRVSRGSLALRALGAPGRPQAGDQLYVAPYWNTEPSRGSVCEGSMKRPQVTDPSTLEIWEDGFFSSQFTHPSGSGVLTTHPQGFMGLWNELAGSGQPFPGSYLKDAKETVQEFLNKAS